jgi:Na+/proline symporter
MGLLAAVMSTADSDLNVTSVSLVKDLFSPIFKEKNQQKLLKVARITNILLGSLAIIIALKFTSIVDLVIFVAGFWGPMLFIPLLFALFDITIQKSAMIICTIAGPSVFLIWEYYFANIYNLKGVFVGTVASLIIFLTNYFIDQIRQKI